MREGECRGGEGRFVTCLLARVGGDKIGGEGRGEGEGGECRRRNAKLTVRHTHFFILQTHQGA